MKFEEYTGKKVTIITDAGFIYGPDKKQRTRDKAKAATWFDCKEDELILIGSYPWTYSAVYFEEDPNVPGAVKASYWNITNSRPKDNKKLSIEFIGFFYIHNNGMLSYAVGCEEAPSKPKRIRKRPAPLTRAENVWWWDYCQNMGCLNSQEVWRGNNLPKSVENILEGQGFIEYTASNWTHPLKNINYGQLADWIAHYPYNLNTSKTKEFINLEKSDIFTPLAEDVWAKVENTPEGVLIRLRDIGESYSDNNYIVRDEHLRILFTNKGTCSRQVKVGNKWESDNRKRTYEFYRIFAYIKQSKGQGKLEGELKDLFANNKKFKYLNDWINKYSDELFNYQTKGESNYWCTNGIIEFLRLYNNYPAFIDTLIKLGYLDAILIEENKEYVWDNSARQTVATGLTWKELGIHGFEQLFNGYPLRSALLSKKKKDFFSTIHINKFQWKVVRNLINNYNENYAELNGGPCSKEGWIMKCLSIFSNLYRFFIYKDGYRVEEPKYKEVKDIPDNEFLMYIEVSKELAKDRRDNIENYNKAIGRSWSSDRKINMFELLWADIRNNEYEFGERQGFVEHIDQYTPLKIFRKAYKGGYSISAIRDYCSMRAQCMRYIRLGFNPTDWPEIPKLEQAEKFHDRLTELYNAYRMQEAEKEESERQIKWEERIKKEKLLNFEYEEDDDNLCMILPKKIVELITEGQRLSHCVGSYTRSVAEGRETILFLRKKEAKNTPYMTVDIAYNKDSKMWQMRQCHGFRNCDPTHEDVEFLKKWGAKNNVDLATIQEHTGALCAL